MATRFQHVKTDMKRKPLVNHRKATQPNMMTTYRKHVQDYVEHVKP